MIQIGLFLSIWIMLSGVIFIAKALSEEGHDILLKETTPITSDERIVVATYYHNEPNYYYFTMVYAFTPYLQKYRTRIVFTIWDAEKSHDCLEKWIIKRHKRRGNLFPEPYSIVPFIPAPKEGVDYFTIHPRTVYHQRHDEISPHLVR